MHIILGGTGRVGSAVARHLLDRGEPVTVVTRDPEHASDLEAAGANVAAADLQDLARLRDLLRSGRRAFLLNPPATPDTDTDVVERANVAAILEALDGSGLEKVVAASTYGARPGERCGDLTVLHELEQGLMAQAVPAAINRGAYYMSNWSGLLDEIRETGTLNSFFPEDLQIPMVAPQDVGEAAARRMMGPVADVGLRHVEGPRRYTPPDVADAFAEALDRSVVVKVVARERWEEIFRQLGFSDPAAKSYACMTGTVVDGTELPTDPEPGPTSLHAYIGGVVSAAH